jgi:hypothetical protein
MDEEFEFFYLVIVEVQIGLDGKEYYKDVLVEGHITHGSRLLCGESREVLRNQVKTKYEAQTVKEKVAKLRVERTKVCPVCQEKYKKNGHSAYTAWVEGKAKTPATKLPTLAKF